MSPAVADDDRLAFAPPQQAGQLRSFALAVLAHALLMLALMNGLNWKRDGEQSPVEAELWSAVPQQAAPKEQPVAPPPPPQPVVKAPPQPDPQLQREAQIALEREKHKRELEMQKQAELEREREKQRKLEAQKKHEEELAKKQEQQKQVAEAKRKEDEKKRKQQEARDAKALEQMREDNIKRSQAMAGGTGAPDANGTAARASGPSASWAGRVQARVRPNIVFSDDVSGNPKAEVEVRTAPDGTIVGRRLVRSSGVKAWDEAVLRALDKTEALPRDVDGRVPSPVVIEFRPRG